MTTSFYNGISGIISFQTGIDILGDNIANINTLGFKETIPEFATLLSKELNLNTSPASNIGLGSYINSTSKDMSLGSFVSTGNKFDLAIAEDGWFALKHKEQLFYTRNGNFTKDMKGFLVNKNGEYLLVANADNLIQKEGKNYIDKNIDTTNLLPSDNLSPISLPDNVILPAVATENVSLKTNLNDDYKIDTTKAAGENIDMSSLYDKDGNDLQIRNSQSLVFGFGNRVSYESGNLISVFCFEDDLKDSKNIDIDFTLNGKKIKLTLPDGTKKEDIAKAISKELKNKGFLADAKNGELSVKTQDKFILISNTPILKNTAAAKLTYKTQSQNEYEFSTFKDFIKNIQNLANLAYLNKIKIDLDEKGRVEIKNNSSLILNSYIEKTENSNEKFLKNLGRMGNEIYPKTSNKSNEFNVNNQEFGGYIINEKGDKFPVIISFTKSKVLTNQIIWRGEITINKDDNPIKITKDFVFDSKGTLLYPKEISFNNINFKFDLTSYTKSQTNQISYSFNQDGIEESFLKNYEIKEDGKIVGVFSNNQYAVFGQIPVFHFQNEQGLQSIGENIFIQTENSGKAFLYTDNQNNYIPSKILSSTLEESNVNFSEAMTQLIVTQKAFQASAKTVTTSDEMIQKAINLKR